MRTLFLDDSGEQSFGVRGRDDSENVDMMK